MQTQDIWWENIFEGHLAHGVNKERMSELEREEFLYFEMDEVDEPLNHLS